MVATQMTPLVHPTFMSFLNDAAYTYQFVKGVEENSDGDREKVLYIILSSTEWKARTNLGGSSIVPSCQKKLRRT